MGKTKKDSREQKAMHRKDSMHKPKMTPYKRESKSKRIYKK